MLLSLNYDSKDPKYTLLAEIFNIIDSKKARNILSRKVVLMVKFRRLNKYMNILADILPNNTVIS